MSAKRIAFIEPSGDASNVFEKYMRLPLMGTLYLGTILHEAGYAVRIYNENVMPRPIDPFHIEADIYCISALTVSANRGHMLAYEIKRIRPDAKVIVGGIHATLVPEDFVDVADYVVRGEAEGIIVDLVEGRFDEQIVDGAPLEDLDSLPPVRYELLEYVERMDIVPMMTSRGCPFDCDFCTVTQVFGRRFRKQSPERIVHEIEHAIDFFGECSFFIYDDNFAADRKRVEGFCDLVEAHDLDIRWSAQVRSDLAREEALVGRMERAGARRFYIGFESIDDEALKAMHKAQTRSDIERAIRVFRSSGIAIHGMFMLGTDQDTVESIRATVDFAIQQHIDTVQFMIITPMAGTRFYDAIASQGRILHRRWDYFNGMFVVFQPKNLSPADLQRETIRAYRRFYSLRRLALDTLELSSQILLDALTWNFHNAFLYSFDSMLLQGGARFLIDRFAPHFEPYIQYLESVDEETPRATTVEAGPHPAADGQTT